MKTFPLYSYISNKLPRLAWGGLLLSCLLPTSCLNDESYTTSPTDRLTFSVDTLSLDTIISGRASNTYTFEVYNSASKSLRLTSVALGQGGDSPFRVNVDGVYLDEGRATDLEVRGGDSLRVFIFANIPERDSDTPTAVTDHLRFTTEGGAVQEVVLQAWGQDVIPLTTTTMTGDTTLDAARPYLISDSLVVAAGATLTINPGVRLYFHPDARLVVHGTLKATGTVDAPVVMRGDRLGYMFSHQAYDRIPGQWDGIVFTEESSGNRLDHCDIHSGTSGIVCYGTTTTSDDSAEQLRIENSVVHNMSGNALTIRGANVFVGNSQVSNAGGNCVTLLGGNSTFVHCTIANFYAFSSDRGVALSYANYDGDTRLPLRGATFRNCIITGYSSDEIMGAASDRYQDDAFNYCFDHCLLNTPEVIADGITDCLWDNSDAAVYREQNFSPDFDLTQLIFSFSLSEDSQAVDAADAATARQYYPTDRLGRSRLADGGPDMGCYEWQAPAQ